MKDPLYVLTVIVGLCLLMVFGKYVVLDKFDKEVVGVLATILGGLITALGMRKQDKPNAETYEEPPLPPPGGGDDARDQ